MAIFHGLQLNSKLLVRFFRRLGKCPTDTMGLFHGSPRKVINFVLAYRLRHPELKEKTKEARSVGCHYLLIGIPIAILVIVFLGAWLHMTLSVKEISSNGKEIHLLTNVINSAIDQHFGMLNYQKLHAATRD